MRVSVGGMLDTDWMAVLSEHWKGIAGGSVATACSLVAWLIARKDNYKQVKDAVGHIKRLWGMPAEFDMLKSSGSQADKEAAKERERVAASIRFLRGPTCAYSLPSGGSYTAVQFLHANGNALGHDGLTPDEAYKRCQKQGIAIQRADIDELFGALDVQEMTFGGARMLANAPKIPSIVRLKPYGKLVVQAVANLNQDELGAF